MLIHFKMYKKTCPDRKMQTFPQVLLANDFRMLQTRNSKKKNIKKKGKKGTHSELVKKTCRLKAPFAEWVNLNLSSHH